MNTKVRESNLELLRIVSMLLVLLAHYIPTRGSITPETFDNNPLNTIINIELKSLAFVCVNCFILISGYFEIKFKLKSLCNLLFQMIFWSIICVIIGQYIFDAPKITFISFIKSICYGWFPESYIILFFLSPILNTFIERCSTKELGKYIIIFYLLSTIGYFYGFHNFLSGMSALSLIGIYLIGAYLKRSKLNIFSFKTKYNILIYLSLGFALAILNITLLYFGVKSSPYGFLNPVIILMSVYLFLFFKNLRIGHIGGVNFLAASAFSIYLFHCNINTAGKINEMWYAINDNFGVISSLFIALLSFIGIYLFCTIVDRVRIYLYDILYNIFIKNIPNNY